jgi:hypothetical protein
MLLSTHSIPEGVGMHKGNNKWGGLRLEALLRMDHIIIYW